MSAIFGEVLTLPQASGPGVELATFGDEFYARYESQTGYSVIYDSDKGLYCYAMVLNGRFVSSGTPLSKQPPIGVPRHLRETAEVRNEKFEMRYQLMRRKTSAIGPMIQTFGRENGLLEGRRVSSGKVRGLTVLVQFSDEQAAITKDDVDAMLNGDAYTRNGNFCSVNQYYRMMSADALNYSNLVVGPITLSRGRDYYISNLLVEEALDILVEDMGIDLAQFDSRNEGYVDALSFMYAGRTVYSDWLWPHNFTIDLKYSGIRTNYYTIQSMGRRAIDLSIGTFCHESGHMLCRFPDVYDYGTRDGDFEKSAGMGKYCLMGAGNHLDRGRTPSPISAYLRDLAGWTDNQVDISGAGVYQAKHGDYGSVLRFDTENPNEYFLVENRSGMGLDAHLPSAGLAVYHCDTLGSNEWQTGDAEKHYQVGLLQADGHLDLEQNLNTGDQGDLYKDISATAVSHETKPSSLKWDGSDSGLVISNVTNPGDIISFTSGIPAVPGNPAGSVVRELKPDLLIPDDEPSGVTSEIELGVVGVVEAIVVAVDITHTYVGDLKLTLEGPSGHKVVLHDKSGGSSNDLVESYESGSGLPLSEFLDESTGGIWKLHISDHARRDTGRLNQWRLEIAYRRVEQQVELVSTPELAIPDHPSPGVMDRITVGKSGSCQDISIAVSISHTFIGDLKIDLISPSGRTLTLYQGEGGSRKNLETVFDRSSTPLLTALDGEAIEGDWSLAITDQAGADSGTLDRWSLSILYG